MVAKPLHLQSETSILAHDIATVKMRIAISNSYLHSTPVLTDRSYIERASLVRNTKRLEALKEKHERASGRVNSLNHIGC